MGLEAEALDSDGGRAVKSLDQERSSTPWWMCRIRSIREARTDLNWGRGLRVGWSQSEPLNVSGEGRI